MSVAEFLNRPLPIAYGQQSLRNRVALAPMAGMTDVPFRTLAWRFGAGHMVSEMVTSKPELWDTGKSRARRVLISEVRPQAVQIAGHDPATMAESARRLTGEGVEWVDLNFGCPAKKVCRKAAGSALLANIDQISRIVAAVVSAVDVPVSIKTRTGLSLEDSAGTEAAIAAQEAGAQLVVMHGRSRACRFKGHACPDRVREARRLLRVPLLVNGDIVDDASAEQALKSSGADGVMLGRGAMGQPWIFAEFLGLEMPTAAERFDFIREHLDAMHSFYGEDAGVRIARKHIQAYLQRWGTPQWTGDFMGLTSAQQQHAWLLARREQMLLHAAINTSQSKAAA